MVVGTGGGNVAFENHAKLASEPAVRMRPLLDRANVKETTYSPESATSSPTDQVGKPASCETTASSPTRSSRSKGRAAREDVGMGRLLR